jgi:hypothetical protein
MKTLVLTPKTMMMTIIKLIKQPTGNTCGPACLAMVYEYINALKGIGKKSYKQFVEGETGDIIIELENKEDKLNAELVDSIANVCGTDWKVGTPPDRLEKGLKHLELDYIEYSHMKSPYALLINVLESKNIAILRTITKGVPHWIIVSDINENEFKILDPWLGEIEYTETELDSIWKIRNYQFFEIQIPNQTYYL